MPFLRNEVGRNSLEKILEDDTPWEKKHTIGWIEGPFCGYLERREKILDTTVSKKERPRGGDQKTGERNQKRGKVFSSGFEKGVKA